ncbi:MAG: hypothetical protein J6L64_07165 [Opitutales bacterium]|nr:hypothetical protein [Opitutales bacterium]
MTILNETDFSTIAALSGATVVIAGAPPVPAIVSTLSDEKEAVAGGIIGKTTLKVRVMEQDITGSIRTLPGKILRYDGNDYRILSAKKHPLSVAYEFTICEL